MMHSDFKMRQVAYSVWVFIKAYWHCLLILLAFIGFVSKSLYNYPIGIMAILGLYQIIVAPRQLITDPVLKTFSVLFLCLWLPLLLALIDAVDPIHSKNTVIPYLRFFFAGAFIIQAVGRDPRRLRFIIISLFYIVFFWCIDAVIQFTFGKNLLGFPLEYHHGESNISGMFYPKPTIAHVCSVLSPFYFLYLYPHLEKKPWLLLTLLPLFFVIFISGRRAAWIMLALSCFGFLIYGDIYAIKQKRFIKQMMLISTIITMIFAATIVLHQPTKHNFNRTLGLFGYNADATDHQTKDYKTLFNRASTERLPAWKTAYTIFKLNPLNGIGARGFRHIYNEHAAPYGYHYNAGEAVLHPHLIILEIMAEAGLIGLVAYILAQILLFNMMKQSNHRKALFPFFLAVMVALFPLNAHMAFYGSIWSSMCWLLIILFLAQVKLTTNNDF